MVPTKDRTPHVPVTTEEILEDVAACRELGASVIHVHARDESQRPTHRADAFAPIVEGIRAIDPDLIVCVTCSGRRVGDLERRAEVLSLDGPAKPDMASLTLGSNNFAREASANPPEVIRGLAGRMKERGIRAELEVFEPGMAAFAKVLLDEGLLTPPCCFNILLGGPGTSPLSASALAAFLAELPDRAVWGVAGIGRYQLAANAVGLALGGHVRTGLEDNIRWDGGGSLATNAQLVGRIAELAAILGRPLAQPSEARELLGLPPAGSASLPRAPRLAKA
jgi:uncharacterized protein (DUF849 family)